MSGAATDNENKHHGVRGEFFMAFKLVRKLLGEKPIKLRVKPISCLVDGGQPGETSMMGWDDGRPACEISIKIVFLRG